MPNADKEIDLKIARINLNHSLIINVYGVMLTVIFTLIITIPTIYVPLGYYSDNDMYYYVSALAEVIFFVPAVWVFFQMKNYQRNLLKELRKVKLEFYEREFVGDDF
jgi:hypothetical protein